MQFNMALTSIAFYGLTESKNSNEIIPLKMIESQAELFINYELYLYLMLLVCFLAYYVRYKI